MYKINIALLRNTSSTSVNLKSIVHQMYSSTLRGSLPLVVWCFVAFCTALREMDCDSPHPSFVPPPLLLPLLLLLLFILLLPLHLLLLFLLLLPLLLLCHPSTLSSSIGLQSPQFLCTAVPPLSLLPKVYQITNLDRLKMYISIKPGKKCQLTPGHKKTQRTTHEFQKHADRRALLNNTVVW